MSKQRAHPTSRFGLLTSQAYIRATEALGGLCQCARLLGISKTTLHYRKTGKSQITLEMSIAIQSLIKEYKIDDSQLYSDDYTPIKTSYYRRGTFGGRHSIGDSPLQ